MWLPPTTKVGKLPESDSSWSGRQKGTGQSKENSVPLLIVKTLYDVSKRAQIFSLYNTLMIQQEHTKIKKTLWLQKGFTLFVTGKIGEN